MYIFSLWCFLLLTTCSIKAVKEQCISDVSRIFLFDVIYKINGNDIITVEDLQTAFNICSSVETGQTFNFTDCSGLSNTTDRENCILAHCLSIDDILQLHTLPRNKSLTAHEFYSVIPSLLFKNIGCQYVEQNRNAEVQKSSPLSDEAWGFGFASVTIRNMFALSGAVFIPCTKKTFYHKIMIFMVGLAVGSLAANGLLVLIPEALELMHIEGIRQTYIWKCSTVVGSIYLFFVIERFLQHFVQIKKPKYKDSLALVPKIKITSSSSICADAVSMDDGSVVMGDFDLLDQLNQDEGINKNDMINSNASKSIRSDTKTVSSVAWMIIVGHGFHSFIDGLTIGAAFTESLITGISISVSIFCEELPNGLGDFAILVNSGMTGKKALMFNFLSACMCYFGLIAGTILGENTAAHEWVFAIAGGMFLYLSLVDMMPEMNSEAESEENKKNIGPLQIFLLQNFGMGVGFSVILIMAVYGGNIEF